MRSPKWPKIAAPIGRATKPTAKHGEGLQGAGQRVGRWKIQFRKDQCRHLAVEQESYHSIVVPTVLASTARRNWAG
jgi:hypothetical protein